MNPALCYRDIFHDISPADGEFLDSLTSSGTSMPRELERLKNEIYHSDQIVSPITRMFLRVLVGLYVYHEVDVDHYKAIFYTHRPSNPEFRRVQKRFINSPTLSRFLRVKFRRLLKIHALDNLADNLAFYYKWFRFFYPDILKSSLDDVNDVNDVNDLNVEWDRFYSYSLDRVLAVHRLFGRADCKIYLFKYCDYFGIKYRICVYLCDTQPTLPIYFDDDTRVEPDHRRKKWHIFSWNNITPPPIDL